MVSFSTGISKFQSASLMFSVETCVISQGRISQHAKIFSSTMCAFPQICDQRGSSVRSFLPVYLSFASNNLASKLVIPAIDPLISAYLRIFPSLAPGRSINSRIPTASINWIHAKTFQKSPNSCTIAKVALCSSFQYFAIIFCLIVFRYSKSSQKYSDRFVF